MPATQTHCLNCLPSPNPESEGHDYVCDLTKCLHTLTNAGASRATRRSIIPAKRNRRAETDPEPLIDDEPEAETELDVGAADPAAPARPVRNRAGMTVMARAGRRPCDHRCQFARGRICSCRCGGINHGIGAV